MAKQTELIIQNTSLFTVTESHLTSRFRLCLHTFRMQITNTMKTDKNAENMCYSVTLLFVEFSNT